MYNTEKIAKGLSAKLISSIYKVECNEEINFEFKSSVDNGDNNPFNHYEEISVKISQERSSDS
jgi:hypothetical protein